MTFAISNNVITQSGTDTDLSGLAGVAGVTTTTYSGSGTYPAKIIYNLGNAKLEIAGTLTHDPSKEVITIGGGANNRPIIHILSGGTYNYGVETTFQGGTHYSVGEGLYIRAYLSGSLRQFNGSQAGIRNQGQFNWLGGTISSGRSIITDNGGNIKVRNGIFRPWSTNNTGT